MIAPAERVGPRTRARPGARAGPLSVLLVEDHASFRQALAAVLALEPDLRLVAEVGRGEQAGPAAARHGPDVAVVDLDLPGADGVAAVADIRRASPGTACLVLTALTDEADLGRAVEAGAAAILHKSVGMDELLDTVRRAAEGVMLLAPDDVCRWLGASRAARDRHWWRALLERSLTVREKEVLSLLSEGGTNQSIARELGISPDTVQTHVRNLMGKLDERSRLEAVTTAIRLGLVDPPSAPCFDPAGGGRRHVREDAAGGA